MSTQTDPAPSGTISTFLFAQQQQRSLALRYEPVTDRFDRLKKLKGWIQTHRPDIQQAIYQDFKKPSFETDTSEVLICLQEIDFALNNSCYAPGINIWLNLRVKPLSANTMIYG